MNKIQFSILPLQKIEILRMTSFQLDLKPTPFLEYSKSKRIKNYLLDDICNVTNTPNSVIIVAKLKNKIVGIAVFENLFWEAKILKKNVGHIKHLAVLDNFLWKSKVYEGLIKFVNNYALKNKVNLLVHKTNTIETTKIHFLERNGFYLVDTLLDFVYDFDSFPFKKIHPPQKPKGISIRIANQKDIDSLVLLTKKTFSSHFGRFHSDESIPPKLATKIYEEWIKSSLKGWADWIIIAETGGKVAGYSIWKKTTTLEKKHKIRIGHYSIGAIHPDHYGKGLFRLLTYEGMKYFKDLVDYIEGPTHINNYPVQRGYLSLGWKIVGARHSFHKWLPN